MTSDTSYPTKKMEVIFKVLYHRDGKYGSISIHEHAVVDFDVWVDGVIVYHSSPTTVKEVEA